jgi:XRE family transcriptional regulator, aerobic/anaerobic benzoate catabolism transcriptional regulator
MQQSDIAGVVARQVRASRKRMGWSRKQLAAAAGVSERYLSELETGAANASIGILARIAQALKTDIVSLLSGPAVDGPALAAASQGPLAELAGSLSLPLQQAAMIYLTPWVMAHRKHPRGIALLGLRGAGKTTIGGRYAERHGMPFVSITREIEARAGMSLADLFNLGGPDAYRALENEVADELSRRDDQIVLETGGGIASNEEALARVLGAFKTVWIKASPQEHLDRVIRQGDMRPARDNPKALDHLKSLLTAREAEYGRAECVLDTTGRSVEACVAELEVIAGTGETRHIPA